MALIKPGAIVSAISGTIGGVNFAVNSQRAIARKARRRVVVYTQRQLQRRAAFKTVIDAWRSLTAAQRAAWATLAEQQRWKDRLGQARQPSGREFFISHNIELALADQTLDTTAAPVALNASFWTGGALTFASSTSATYQAINPLFGPYPYLNLYIQTFFRPTPQWADTLFGDVDGVLPNKWVFCKYYNGLSNGINLFPEAGTIVGEIQSGQRLAVLAKYVQPGYFSTTHHTTLKTR